MNRYYYSDSIASFVAADTDAILGRLAGGSDDTAIRQTQVAAWRAQVEILKPVLADYNGQVYFEYAIPRMGSRIDAVVLIGPGVFVLEFKVGASEFSAQAIDQVWDYALDLKNFHETSHHRHIAPVLIATEAQSPGITIGTTRHNDRLLWPIRTGLRSLPQVFKEVLSFVEGTPINAAVWESGSYSPTPTIIEAASALYKGHSVDEISRSDAGAKNLHETTEAISEIIQRGRENQHKSICFVTGVPGAGKTLIGLDIATKHLNAEDDTYSVFLSGNGPLVKVLQEALARDKVAREKARGGSITKKKAYSEVKAFVQNVHHYRDAYVIDPKPPADHVALFDEAQRAWNLEQTTRFMRQKRKIQGFNESEPEFLISCIDRHPDWGVVVCLVGGGQEIHTGEAGISEWLEALDRSFPHWHIHISDRLTDSEYGTTQVLGQLADRPNVHFSPSLHLAVSMRSFRAEHVSRLVKQVLDLEQLPARDTLAKLSTQYPIAITRDLAKAKRWVREQARGSERYGLVVSSHAERLKPHAIDVKSPVNPIHWFLSGKQDVRSSYYMESVATEFHIQGLELDWACVTWDADFRYSPDGWVQRSFKGSKWQKIRKPERQVYQKNAYRVLLTRARQGMVIVVPPGDPNDSTRLPEFYDSTYQYLQNIGFQTI
jgi:hypothetical protein